ncbi:Protein of unknown function [Singulisphaera sp. GP187]|uniref:DUF2934 domain-containing protein n=1 Tax=Singulisphaera sp. GP187 TaxID=1882752 RepID=UPI0009284A04|nr:DUF2934 domain-containing protein [Singulisphaera sp. GP187]SIO58245.1 Protein of unknown function [Singulisphaera sp. GP187]
MFPTADQIEHEAYLRWERRGGSHGNDRGDWCAAEQDLLLTLNYEVAAFYALNAAKPQFIGTQGRRVCRFCEQAAPIATFSAIPAALPAFLENRSLFTYEECDDCHAHFASSVEADLEAFLTQLRSGSGPNSLSQTSIAALKGLAKMALSILPAAELHSFEDTREWVVNPDHDFDLRLFGELGCGLHTLPSIQADPWTALVRRVDDEAPMPYMLFFVGTAHVVIQAPVPLSARDEDLDGTRTIIPRTDSSYAMGSEPGRQAPSPFRSNPNRIRPNANSPI